MLNFRDINEELIRYLLETYKNPDFIILSEELYKELTGEDIFPLPEGVYRNLLGIPIAITQKKLEKGFEIVKVV